MKFCLLYIRYLVISVVNKQYKAKEFISLGLEKTVCYIRYFVISDLFISSFHCNLIEILIEVTFELIILYSYICPCKGHTVYAIYFASLIFPNRDFKTFSRMGKFAIEEESNGRRNQYHSLIYAHALCTVLVLRTQVAFGVGIGGKFIFACC